MFAIKYFIRTLKVFWFFLLSFTFWAQNWFKKRDGLYPDWLRLVRLSEIDRHLEDCREEQQLLVNGNARNMLSLAAILVVKE